MTRAYRVAHIYKTDAELAASPAVLRRCASVSIRAAMSLLSVARSLLRAAEAPDSPAAGATAMVFDADRI